MNEQSIRFFWNHFKLILWKSNNKKKQTTRKIGFKKDTKTIFTIFIGSIVSVLTAKNLKPSMNRLKHKCLQGLWKW